VLQFNNSHVAYRVAALLRRAEALRKEQEALAAELAALNYDASDESQQEQQHQHVEDLFRGFPLNENCTYLRNRIYDPTAGEIPPGILRNELERLLGLRPADSPDDPLSHKETYFEEADALARAIEEGHGSMEPPPGFFDRPPEPAEAFLARLEESVQVFERMMWDKKEQTRLRRERKARGEADYVDTSASDAAAFQSLLNAPPEMFPEESTANIPAPDIPPAAAEQFHRAERVQLVLRRAFLKDKDAAETLLSPAAGVYALKARGLVAEDVVFEDPWMEMRGIRGAEHYLEALMHHKAGVEMEIDTLFSSYYEYKYVRKTGGSLGGWRMSFSVCLLLSV
jgi:hypothetical protein